MSASEPPVSPEGGEGAKVEQPRYRLRPLHRGSIILAMAISATLFLGHEAPAWQLVLVAGACGFGLGVFEAVMTVRDRR